MLNRAAIDRPLKDASAPTHDAVRVINAADSHGLVRDFTHGMRTIRHPVLTAVGVMVERRPPATSA